MDILARIQGKPNSGKEAFAKLLDRGSLTIEGKLNGRDVQYHSIVDLKRHHLQAAIIDITENRLVREGFEYTASALARAAEAHDELTGDHLVRMNSYSNKLAEILDCNLNFIKDLTLLAQLHDVGKVHIEQKIITKEGSLTTAEYDKMKRHSLFGAKIIGDHPKLALARQIALGHHERWDGTGYPYGLSGEMIPFPAQIVAVADVFDALVSKRSYKPAFDYDQTYKIMSNGDSRLDPQKYFNPRILKVFIKNFDIFTWIHSRFKG